MADDGQLCAFGPYTNNAYSPYLGFNLFGGWVTYALIGGVLIFLLSYFDVKWSAYAMASFLILEVDILIVLDLVVTLHGGVAGHDVVHTFTVAGADLKGAAPGVFWVSELQWHLPGEQPAHASVLRDARDR